MPAVLRVLQAWHLLSHRCPHRSCGHPSPRSQLECQAMPLQPPQALHALALQRLAALRLRAVRLA
jgi:hypothetical protein